MDYHELYETHVDLYHDLVSAEDYQQNLKKTLDRLINYKVHFGLEMGVGTGRVTKLLAHKCDHLLAYDLHQSMLDKIKISSFAPCKVDLVVADHLQLPDFDTKLDVIVAGWTICHIIDDFPVLWKEKVDSLLQTLSSNQSKQSKLIIIETLGTGDTTESAPVHLKDYYKFMESQGFTKEIIRTDYRFESLDQAKRLVPFFFGEEMLSKLQQEDSYILPECTGIWSKG